METSPVPPTVNDFLVAPAIQLSWWSIISLVSSIDTTFDSFGMKREIAFIREVLPEAVPPAKSTLILFSMAIQ
ncbi:hypothetical protein SDC9_113486 [bioreactor metagenome]|uniref:Uncharacterized protein n=1 Tax=bioreactor metagenome TaxID=1076179 RepID=A0A645BMH8_9ZZZZ